MTATAGRGPASVGAHFVRRARTARVHRLVSDADPADPGPEPAPGLPDCGRATERANAVIEHPPGEETQWDWLDLPDPPDRWGWGTMAHLLVGSLAHSGRWRGYLSADDGPAASGRRAGPDQPESGRGDPAVAVRPDGHRLPPRLRPGHRHLRRGREALRGHDQICPPKAGHRKGVVEKVNHTAAQRWWRTLADELTVEQAQADCDRFATVRGDTRLRRSHGDRKATVATVAAAEPLRPVPPAPYPLQLTADPDGVAAGAGRLPREPVLGAAGACVRDRHRDPDRRRPDVSTSPPARGSSSPGTARTRRHRGPGPRPRTCGRPRRHRHEAAAAARGPHRRKERIPPGRAARAAAATLRGEQPTRTAPAPSPTSPPTNAPPAEGTPCHDQHHSGIRRQQRQPAAHRRGGLSLPAAPRAPRHAAAAHRRRAAPRPSSTKPAPKAGR